MGPHEGSHLGRRQPHHLVGLCDRDGQRQRAVQRERRLDLVHLRHVSGVRGESSQVKSSRVGQGHVPRVSSAHLLGEPESELRFGRRLALLLGRRRRRGRGRGTRSFRGIGRRRARRRCSTLLATAAHEQRMVSKWWVEDRGYSGAGAKVAPAGEESAGGSKGVGGAVRLTLGRI